MSIYRKYYLNDFVVDVFGYNEETERFSYCTYDKYYGYYSEREAKKRYKYPDKRNPYIFQYGMFINVILPNKKRVRLFLE